MIPLKKDYKLILSKKSIIQSKSSVDFNSQTKNNNKDNWDDFCLKSKYYFLHSKWTEVLHTKQLSILEIDYLNWINFNKNCFPGQEITTRFYMQEKEFFQKIYFFQTNSIPKNLTKLEKLSKIYCESTDDSIGKILDFTLLKNNALFFCRLKKKLGDEESLIISDETYSGKLFPIPSQKLSPNEIADLLKQGFSTYHQNDFSQAKTHFETILSLDPYHPDALEALAVIYEKEGNIKKAIKLNKRFAQSDPKAVMAHTNLSRLYMLQGFIEKAEEEKQKATVLMFRQTSKENHEELKKKQSEEIKKKLEIFDQVLEIDPLDETANYGKGKIYFDQEKYSKSKKFLEKVIAQNPNYSTAYLYLSKATYQLGEEEECRKTLFEGIPIAKKQGDMMPLKGMEELKKKLENSNEV